MKRNISLKSTKKTILAAIPTLFAYVSLTPTIFAETVPDKVVITNDSVYFQPQKEEKPSSILPLTHVQGHRGVIRTPDGDKLSEAAKISREARLLLVHDDIEGAEAKYQQALKTFDLHSIHAGLGNVQLARGRFSEAMAQYRIAADNSVMPDTDLALHMALALEKMGQYADAIVMYRVALRLPVNRSYLSGPMAGDPLGDSYAKASAHALLDVSELDIAFEPQAFDGRLFEAAVHAALGKFNPGMIHELSMKEYNLAIKLRPDFAPAYLYRGMELHFNGKPGEGSSNADCERAISLDQGAAREKAEVFLGRRIRLNDGSSIPNPGIVPAPR